MTRRRRGPCRRNPNSWTRRLKADEKNQSPEKTSLSLLSRVLKILMCICIALIFILTIFCCIIYLVENTEIISSGFLIRKAADFRLYRKNYEMAFALWTRIHRMNRHQFGPKHEKSLDALFQLGSISLLLGHEEEALTFFIKVYTTRGKILGDDHPETKKAVEQVVQIQGGILVAKGVLSRECSSDGTFCAPQGQKMSDEEFADIMYESLYKHALTSSEAFFGKSTAQATTYTNEQALDLYENGRVEEALTVVQTAHEKRSSLQGAAHPETIYTLVVLVEILSKEGRLPEATKLALDNFHQQQEQQQQDEGNKRHNKRFQAFALEMVAGAYFKERKFLEAEQIFEKLYHFYHSFFGQTHKFTMGSLANFLNTMTLQEDFNMEEALQLYKILLKGEQEILTNVKPKQDVDLDFVISLSKLAAIANRLEDFETSLKYSSQLYDILQHEPELEKTSKSGPESRELIQFALELIANANFQLGRLEQFLKTQIKIRQFELEHEQKILI